MFGQKVGRSRLPPSVPSPPTFCPFVFIKFKQLFLWIILTDTNSCSSDKLVVRDRTMGMSFCGNGLPPPLKFRGPQVHISFTTDASHADSGFLLNYNLTAVRK